MICDSSTTTTEDICDSISTTTEGICDSPQTTEGICNSPLTIEGICDLLLSPINGDRDQERFCDLLFVI